MEGSKNVIITIAESNILNKVKTNTYYVGESRKSRIENLDLGTKIQVSNDEDVILKDFIEEGVGKLTALLTHNIGSTSFNNGEFSVKAQANFNENVVEALSSICEDYLTDYVMMLWLNTVKPDEAQVFGGKIQSDIVDIRRLANERKKPTRA